MVLIFQNKFVIFIELLSSESPAHQERLKGSFEVFGGNECIFLPAEKKNTQPFWLLDDFTKSSPAKRIGNFFSHFDDRQPFFSKHQFSERS